MSTESNAIQVSAKVQNAVAIGEVRVDVIEVLRELAKQSDNTIDDSLVEIVATAKGNADWKGVAKGYL